MREHINKDKSVKACGLRQVSFQFCQPSGGSFILIVFLKYTHILTVFFQQAYPHCFPLVRISSLTFFSKPILIVFLQHDTEEAKLILAFKGDMSMKSISGNIAILELQTSRIKTSVLRANIVYSVRQFQSYYLGIVEFLHSVCRRV